METLQDIKRAIARLSTDNMRDLSGWISALSEHSFYVREPAVAYEVEPEPPYMSVDEYLAFEEQQILKHEYVNGAAYAMSGVSERHNLIMLNVASRMHTHVRGGPCKVYSTDFKLRISTQQDEVVYYPDVMVGCTREGVESHWLRYPRLIVEVLSPSTAHIDRREKRLNYTKLSSLEEYVLIAQNRSELVVYRREAGWIPQSIIDPRARVEFRSIALTLPLIEIYEGLQL